jgi:hypothetical protein
MDDRRSFAVGLQRLTELFARVAGLAARGLFPNHLTVARTSPQFCSAWNSIRGTPAAEIFDRPKFGEEDQKFECAENSSYREAKRLMSDSGPQTCRHLSCGRLGGQDFHELQC